jgi:hypothetical protein
MLSADGNKPMGKSGQRRDKKKAEPRKKASEQQIARTDRLEDTQADPIQEFGQEMDKELGEIREEVTAEVSAPVASADILPAQIPAIEIAANPPVVSTDPVPVSPQAIADAYGDYTRKSLERAWTFFGKLATARSPVEAFALQMEFAKEACETFVADAQKISELHGELAKQRSTNFEGLLAKFTQTTFVLQATRH